MLLSRTVSEKYHALSGIFLLTLTFVCGKIIRGEDFLSEMCRPCGGRVIGNGEQSYRYRLLCACPDRVSGERSYRYA